MYILYSLHLRLICLLLNKQLGAHWRGVYVILCSFALFSYHVCNLQKVRHLGIALLVFPRPASFGMV